jgi:hypothetical protein
MHRHGADAVPRNGACASPPIHSPTAIRRSNSLPKARVSDRRRRSPVRSSASSASRGLMRRKPIGQEQSFLRRRMGMAALRRAFCHRDRPELARERRFPAELPAINRLPTSACRGRLLSGTGKRSTNMHLRGSVLLRRRDLRVNRRRKSSSEEHTRRACESACRCGSPLFRSTARLQSPPAS